MVPLNDFKLLRWYISKRTINVETTSSLFLMMIVHGPLLVNVYVNSKTKMNHVY